MIGYRMMKNFSASTLMKGIVEEVEISELRLPNYTIHERGTETIDELALSILQYGLLNPIIIRIRESQFEIISGIRRYLACKKLRWKKIPCHVIEVNDKDSFEISLVENIQRKNLNPIEEARAFQVYIHDFGWGGVSELAHKISKSPSYVSKRLSLLELPMEIVDEISKSKISPSAAEELIYVKNHTTRHEMAIEMIKNDLTVKEVRRLANALSISDATESLEYQSLVDLKENKDLKINRCFDKVLTTLKITQSRIGTIIEEVDDNWIIYETLMHHKNVINNQIDTIIREKKRFNQKLKYKMP
jgi:ParB family transcriptional regulator, chromosome partitioning protein